MLLEIHPEYCTISHKVGRVVKEKIVSLSDVLDELSSYRSTSYGLLPRNIRLMESKGSTLVLGMEIPKITRTLKVYAYGKEEQVVEGVNLPAGLMLGKFLRTSAGLQHLDSFLFAVRGKRITFSSDYLYKYPTPNIYEGGRICWGEVDLGSFKQLSSVEGLVNSFFTNKFNSDLFSSKLESSCPFKIERGVYEYFEFLSENEFEDSWLIETTKSVSNIAAHILGS